MVISLSELKVYKEKYKFLEDENKILKEKLKKSNFNEVENYRLKKLLNIDQKDYAKKLTARILIDPYKSNDSIFFIDLGKIDGLKINDIVFNEFGMIGRIVELGKYSSKVLTIFDTDSVIPVISQKTKIPFFIKGGSLKLSLKHIDKPFNLEHNELIITTDAAGYFKEGIEVGKVVKSLNSVYVEPFAKISDSIYVNVLAFDFEKLIEW
jgi:rod shape-determining protein MreC